MRSILLLILFICLVIDIILVLFAVTRPDRERTSNFTLLCCLLVIYTLGYIAELNADTSGEAHIALIIQNFAIPGIAPFFFLTSITLFSSVKYSHWHTAAAVVYVFTFFTIVLTNDMHLLYYTSIDMIESGGDYFLKLGRGPLYTLNQAASMLLLILGYAFLFVRFFRGSGKIRRQMIFFVIGSFITFVANVLNFSGLLPTGVDPTPIALTLGLIVFSISFILDDLVDVIVRARNIALETMDDALVVLDRDGDFLYCNSSAKSLFPELEKLDSSEPLTGVQAWPVEPGDLDSERDVKFSIENATGSKYYMAQIRMIYRKWRQKSIGVSIVVHDITETTEFMNQLEELAITDPLTNIYNRRSLFELIEISLGSRGRENKSSLVITFDIDNFKQINDNYGHLVGDKVLVEISAAIKHQLRSYDIFGRTGGDEFLIFAAIEDREVAESFVERLQRTVGNLPIITDMGTIKTTASFGAAVIAPDENLQEAIKRADSAMYYAKRHGRNMVHFYEEGVTPLMNTN